MFFSRPANRIPSNQPLVLTFALSDRNLPLTICENNRAKRLTLRIEAGGIGIKVTVPPATDKSEVMRFVERYRGWIESRVQRLPPPQETPMLKAGASIPIFGIPHEIIHSEGRGTVEIHTDQTSKTGKIIVYGEKAHLPRRISDALKKLAERTIAPLVIEYSTIVGRKPISIRYKDTKSRWGSCSTEGNLSFSWRIIMAPHSVIRYLVAHETSHLIEMNHSARFWTLCEKLCPDTKRCRAWLKRNGQALHAIEFK